MNFDPVYQKQFKVVALAWAGCLVAFILIYMLVLSPQKKARADMEQQLDAVKDEFRQAENASHKQNRIKLNKQVEQLNDRLGRYSVGIENLSGLTFDISQMAREQNITSSVDIDTKKSSGAGALRGYSRIDESEIQINCSATFGQFALLLNSLERNSPVVFVDDFQIVRSRTGQNLHEVEMGLSVFVTEKES